MIKFCQQNQESILNKLYNGNIDTVSVSTSNFVDEIILSMNRNGIINCLENSITDKRADNITIPFKLVLALSIASKMKTKTSITDIPFAITDHRVLAELGYSLIDNNNAVNSGLMRESSLRFLLSKYSASDLFSAYNYTVQNHIMPKLDIVPDIHILDCTKLTVNYSNMNYENSNVARDSDGNIARGYKLSTIRGITGDSGIIEDIRFGAIRTHDLDLSKEMLLTTPVFKNGDILINDRGFMSRDVINTLKIKRGVDTYIPLKTNMEAYNVAVTVAQSENKWESHPNPKRKNQKIAFVSNLKPYWHSDNPKNDVDFNACVVWDTRTNDYFVFITTDTTQNAKQIIQIYELRPEIEEDYRQLKDFWKLEDFKSTKLNMIAFHIICVLFGYLFFQIYINTSEGEKYIHKSLPVILKNYQPQKMEYLIFYSDNEFGIFSIIEFAEVYSSCDNSIKQKISNIFNTRSNNYEK